MLRSNYVGSKIASESDYTTSVPILGFPLLRSEAPVLLLVPFYLTVSPKLIT